MHTHLLVLIYVKEQIIYEVRNARRTEGTNKSNSVALLAGIESIITHGVRVEWRRNVMCQDIIDEVTSGVMLVSRSMSVGKECVRRS